MGCDIHIFREVRRGGEWECIDPTYEEWKDEWEDDWKKLVGTAADGSPQVARREEFGCRRDYRLFGELACVRRDSPHSFPDKGFPNNASSPVSAEFEHWDCDAHTPSFLSLRELKTKMAEAVTRGTETVLPPFVADLDFPQDMDPEDCRIVFWFDN